MDGDFPGGPVVKNPTSNAGDVGSIPGRGAKIPHASRPKNQNRSNIVTDSIKTLIMVHIKKKKKIKKEHFYNYQGFFFF